jgi:hypothetical protein
MTNPNLMTVDEINAILDTLPAIEGTEKQIAYANDLRRKVFCKKEIYGCTALALVEFMRTDEYRTQRDANGITDERFLEIQYRRFDGLKYYYDLLSETSSRKIIDLALFNLNNDRFLKNLNK